MLEQGRDRLEPQLAQLQDNGVGRTSIDVRHVDQTVDHRLDGAPLGPAGFQCGLQCREDLTMRLGETRLGDRTRAPHPLCDLAAPIGHGIDRRPFVPVISSAVSANEGRSGPSVPGPKRDGIRTRTRRCSSTAWAKPSQPRDSH